MVEKSTQYYLGELAKVVKEKTLQEGRIVLAREILVGLEETTPQYAENRAKIEVLEAEYEELQAAKTKFMDCVISKISGQGKDVVYQDSTGDVVTPHPEQAVNCTANKFPANTKAEKPSKFENGHNFTRFAKRFREHVMLCNLQGTRLDLYMLSFIKCEQTWEKLHGLNLKNFEMVDIDILIRRYTEELFSPLEATATRAELLAIKQNDGETVEQFCFRISDLASKACYESSQSMADSCLNALISGARYPRVRERILENNIRDYKAAVKIATQTERIKAIQSAPKAGVEANNLYSIAGAVKGEVQNKSTGTNSANIQPPSSGINSSNIDTSQVPVHSLNSQPLLDNYTLDRGPGASCANFGRNIGKHYEWRTNSNK